MDNRQLADTVTDFVASTLEVVCDQHFPSLELPSSYAGHAVQFDASVYLLQTLTGLLELGTGRVGGVDVERRAREIVEAVDPAIEGFTSFTFADSVLRLGGLGAFANPDDVVTAVRSPELIERLGSPERQPPLNWQVVAARCLSAEANLTGSAPLGLETLLDRCRAHLSASETGWVNDMRPPLAQYDIYSPDTYLIAEPLAGQLGDSWLDGFARLFAGLEAVCHPGGAITWGRSSGVLALAMTVELAAAGTRFRLMETRNPWLERAHLALNSLRSVFKDGIIAAHQGRATMPYRGPDHRIQMSFDVLSKLANSALWLRRSEEAEAAPRAETWPSGNKLVPFHPTTNAAVWAYRSPELSFVLPLLRGTTADYQPALRAPGTFESPTAGHPCFVPNFFRNTFRFTPAPLPIHAELNGETLAVTYDGWATQGGGTEMVTNVGGKRRATYAVRGRRVRVSEHIVVDDAGVDEVAVLVPETSTRRLDVTVEGPATVRRIDTSGIAEWRSYWGELPALHQIDVDLTQGQADFTWMVTPHLRVGRTNTDYERALYGELSGRLHSVNLGPPAPRLFDQLTDLDIVHVGWPEHWCGTDPGFTAEVLEAISDAEVKLVRTQHNLCPHDDKSASARRSYAMWAEAADGVIHHTSWGEAVARRMLPFRDDARHVVIHHGHWGPRYRANDSSTRALMEAALRWPPCQIRLAVIGSPRREKHLGRLLEAFAATTRQDLQLVVRLAGGERVPADHRIIVETAPVTEDVYARRMAAIDAIVLPFDDGDMLTTGPAFDAIGSGTAVIASAWGFNDEVFGDAAIRYGSTGEELTDCLEHLTPTRVAACAAAVAELRDGTGWDRAAESTLALFESLAP